MTDEQARKLLTFVDVEQQRMATALDVVQFWRAGWIARSSTPEDRRRFEVAPAGLIELGRWAKKETT